MNIGFDLDGVIAARPLIFKLNHTQGQYRIHLSTPEQWFWALVLGLRRPSWILINKLRSLKVKGNKLYLITGRLSFLENLTLWWLEKYHLTQYFSQVLINIDNHQPHQFKAEKIKEKRISEFYEDELFTADYLKKHTPARIMVVVDNGKHVREI